MQKLQTILKVGVITVVLALSTSVSRAYLDESTFGVDFYLSLDESGNGAVIGAASVLGSDPFLLAVSPSALDSLSGLSTLRYTTPAGFSITSGDIVLCDPGGPIGPEGIFSDVIRIRGTLNNANIFFFSLQGGGGPADVGLPTALQANVVYLAETSIPGADGGAFWKPAPGQPGDIPFADQNLFTYGYQLISEVPEPSSLALLGLAGVAALLRRRRN